MRGKFGMAAKQEDTDYNHQSAVVNGMYSWTDTKIDESLSQ